MSICMKISHVIFFPLLVVIFTMWHQGHHRSFRISSGILRGTRAAASHIFLYVYLITVFGNLLIILAVS